MTTAIRIAGLAGAKGPSRAGFTLVEILLVMVLIAVAASIVTPRLRKSDSLRALEESTSTLTARIQTAQFLALHLEKPTRIRFSDQDRTYWIEVAVDIEGLQFQPAAGFMGVRTTLAEGIRLTRTDTEAQDQTAFVFSPHGPWDTGSIGVTDGLGFRWLFVTDRPGIVVIQNALEQDPSQRYDTVLQQPL